MSMDDTIIAAVMHERQRVTGINFQPNGTTKENDIIDFYGRRMLKASKRGKVKPTNTDQQIAAAITPIMAWMFWQIAPELLLWIVAAIRKRIWTQEQTGDR
jgi:hypothetical protein